MEWFGSQITGDLLEVVVVLSQVLERVDLVPTTVVLVAAAIAAFTDCWKFRIYNALTLPMLLGGLAYHSLAPQGCGIGASLVGAIFGFATLIVLYLMGGMGAGDVKLMMAIGAWLCMPMTLRVFLASALAAGLYSLVLMAIGKNLSEVWVRLQILWVRFVLIGQQLGADSPVEYELKRTDARRRMIPFAAMVIVGLLSVLMLSWRRVSG